MVGVGTALGVGGGWIVARALAGYQYGVTAADPLTWVGVIGTIALTSLAAAWRPARQATRVDPVQLLREE
jgi:ABC-type antimicrobial peptide transport system permease subunit